MKYETLTLLLSLLSQIYVISSVALLHLLGGTEEKENI